MGPAAPALGVAPARHGRGLDEEVALGVAPPVLVRHAELADPGRRVVALEDVEERGAVPRRRVRTARRPVPARTFNRAPRRRGRTRPRGRVDVVRADVRAGERPVGERATGDPRRNRSHRLAPTSGRLCDWPRGPALDVAVEGHEVEVRALRVVRAHARLREEVREDELERELGEEVLALEVGSRGAPPGGGRELVERVGRRKLVAVDPDGVGAGGAAGPARHRREGRRRRHGRRGERQPAQAATHRRRGARGRAGLAPNRGYINKIK